MKFPHLPPSPFGKRLHKTMEPHHEKNCQSPNKMGDVHPLSIFIHKWVMFIHFHLVNQDSHGLWPIYRWFTEKKMAILQFAKVKYGYYYGINYGSNYGVTNEKPIVHSNTHTNT